MAAKPLYRLGLHRPRLKGVATVVAFHRVDDHLADDPISCSVHRFRQFCRFFRAYFDVVPLSEILRRLREGVALDGALAITLDDGYRGNFTVVAPTLREFGLPASFFIATDFIGTDAVPYWDRELGVQTRWMNWDQVRELDAMGFEIGAHTRSHENLAALSGENLRGEIREAKARLEQELGRPVDLFSYPFGETEHMSEDARTLVKELGFSCCLSAYGGFISAADDPFDLRRVPISHWYSDEWQFGFEAVFQRGR